MSIIARYIFWKILRSSFAVLAGLLALFIFFDTLQEISSGEYMRTGTLIAMFNILLGIPERLYEIMPVSVMIGSMITFSNLSQFSEYAVLRCSGISVTRLMTVILAAGAVFAVLNVCIGEYLSPKSNSYRSDLKLQSSIDELVAKNFKSGYWVKDKDSFVNVTLIENPRALFGISIYVVDDSAQLVSKITAEQAIFIDQQGWQLQRAKLIIFNDGNPHRTLHKSLPWDTALTPETVKLLGVNRKQMSIGDLATYVAYLKENNQQYSMLESVLWSKLSHPLLVLILGLLGLLVARMEGRSMSLGFILFSGVMAGVAIYFLNKLFFSLGSIQGWSPAVYAFLPSTMILLLFSSIIYVLERR